MARSHISRYVMALTLIPAATAATAQDRRVTPSQANVITLLSPYLALNASPLGRRTLKSNLRQGIARNQGATVAQQQIAISDKTEVPTIRADGTTMVRAPGDNIAGGLPPLAIQGAGHLYPLQPVGGAGPRLGDMIRDGLWQSHLDRGPLRATYALLDVTYRTMIPDADAAKTYFANGSVQAIGAKREAGIRPRLAATGPDGQPLPSFAGLPNARESVYDLAYRPTSARHEPDHEGSPRPIKVARSRYIAFDPSLTAENLSFPSGHTQYGYTHGTLLAMLVPQAFRGMLLRASEFADSRVVLGAHYPLDVIASRSMTFYELAQAFTNPLYRNNPAATGQIDGLPPMDVPGMFAKALPEIHDYLVRTCGMEVAICAVPIGNSTDNPYRPDVRSSDTYAFRLTYGLPTLSYRQAPPEAPPPGAPDASVLLAPVFGGSSAAARSIAPAGGFYGTLTSATIGRILRNTQARALAAFNGTPLGYWARLNLWAAVGYFERVTDSMFLDSADRLTAPVGIGRKGALAVNGVVDESVTVFARGRLSGSGTVGPVRVETHGMIAPDAAILRVSGNLSLAPGSIHRVALAEDGHAGRVEATGYASLAGRLHMVAPRGGYKACTSFPVLVAQRGIAGRFTTIKGTFGRLKPSLRYRATQVDLVLDDPGGSCRNTG